MDSSLTLFEKVWRAHEVVPETADTPAVLYVDLHLIHEVTSPQAFTVLRERGLRLRRPERTFATMDHSTPTRTEQILGGAPITAPPRFAAPSCQCDRASPSDRALHR